MMHIRTILYPTDFSPSSDAAFQLACSLARERDAKLIILHVRDCPLIIQSGVMTPPPAPRPDGRDEVQKELSAVRPSDPHVRVEHRLEDGDAAAGILQIAEDLDCDLIVMGTHGRTGLSRLLMGSVAETVLRNARCPVLTVKIPLPCPLV